MASAGLALTAGAPSVWAQKEPPPTSAAAGSRFGKAGQLAIGAERLFGLQVFSATVDPDQGRKTDYSSTGFSFLGGYSDSGTDVPNPSAVPRIALDFFVIDNLSIGGSLTVGTVSATEDDGDDEEDFSATVFQFAPRIGYFFSFAPGIGIWPRAGFAYTTLSTSNGTEDSSNLFQLGVEGMFVYSPVSHVALLVGPTLDFSVTGGFETDFGQDTVEGDLSFLNFGIVASLCVYFGT